MWKVEPLNPTDANSSAEIAVIGGGLVGLATALALTRRGHAVMVLEAEPQLARHQSSHNSGVIHAGLYYKPGSLKADLCRAGRVALYDFCEREGVANRRTGKLVVAVAESELAGLDELERRGRANGLIGLERLDQKGLEAAAPAVRGIAGLWVRETGLVDYQQVAQAYARAIISGGGVIRCGARLVGRTRRPGGHRLETTLGRMEVRYVVTCCGLQADRVARMCGADPGVVIIPFRGEYYELAPGRRDLVQVPVYPVPDPAFPFLGVHFTPTVDGRVEAGPNAVLAFHREGYQFHDLSLRDLASTLTYPGFHRLARRYWRTGLQEIHRSLRKARFVDALQRMVPSIRSQDLVRGGSGVRAQALAPDGRLVDDFHIVQDDAALHVLNAPSPAATASLAIGDHIADRVGGAFATSASIEAAG